MDWTGLDWTQLSGAGGLTQRFSGRVSGHYSGSDALALRQRSGIGGRGREVSCALVVIELSMNEQIIII